MAVRDTELLFVRVRSILVLKKKKGTETNEVRLTVQNKRPESNGVLTLVLLTNKKTT